MLSVRKCLDPNKHVEELMQERDAILDEFQFNLTTAQLIMKQTDGWRSWRGWVYVLKI